MKLAEKPTGDLAARRQWTNARAVVMYGEKEKGGLEKDGGWKERGLLVVIEKGRKEGGRRNREESKARKGEKNGRRSERQEAGR